MSVITKGRIFVDGEQLTAEKLNDLVDDASFNSSTAVDNSTTRVNESGAITVKPEGITSAQLAPSERWQNAYPVGSIYMNASDSENPSTLLGFGTWVAFGAGRVPVGIDGSQSEFTPLGKTSGFKTHTLTVDQMPRHDHVLNRNTYGTHNLLLRRNSNGSGSIRDTDSSVGEPDLTSSGCDLPQEEGGGQAHNNLQPYIVVHMWKRTA